jgi:NADP-dependent 3-hydroxy acid dehydrogenase YdfG
MLLLFILGLVICVYGDNILVTGASSGIGAISAKLFAAKGHNVLVCARRVERLDKLVEEIGLLGAGRAVAVPCDVSQPEQVENAFKVAIQVFGSVDHVLANAGCASASSYSVCWLLACQKQCQEYFGPIFLSEFQTLFF